MLKCICYKKNFTVFLVFLILSNNILAQLSISSLDTDFTIDFESTVSGVNNGTFMAGGFESTPASGNLDIDGFIVTGFSSDLTFGGTDATTGDFARGSSAGGVSTGGVYAFDIGSGDIILGIQPGGSDFTPGTIRLAMTNNTGSTVRTINIAYTIAYDNDQERSNSLNFSYSPDNTVYYSLNSLDFATPEASDVSGWQTATRSISITGLAIANTSNYYLSWEGNDVSGSFSRDEYGVDDIVISMSSSNLDILISEIMYNPNSPESDWEWIEIYNNSSSSIDLSNFILDDNAGTALVSANITSGILAGNTGIVLNNPTISSTDFTSAWGGSGSITLGVVSANWPQLNNSSDGVGIWTNLTRYNSQNFTNALDQVNYEDATNSWPNVTNAQSISYNDGTFAADNNLASSWSLSTSSGSTPVGTGYSSSINGTTNTGLDIGSPYGNMALPVDLIEFKAVKKETIIALSWATASETNNDRFEIEKSNNGEFFQKFGEVIGSGNSDVIINYSFEDNAPLNGINYFRLKQIDFDGKFEYSVIEAVAFNNFLNPIRIYPNPSQQNLTVELSKPLQGKTTLELIDFSGKILYNRTVDGEYQNVEIQTSDVPPGIYFLKIINGFDHYLEKVIKN